MSDFNFEGEFENVGFLSESAEQTRLFASKFAKILSLIAVSSIAFVQSLFAEEAPTPPNTEWTVTGTSGTIITEVLPEGASEDDRPWVFTLTDKGALKKTQQGTGKVLNFRTIPLPENYVIKYISSSKYNGTDYIYNGYEPFDHSGIEELYWPDTITSISVRTYDECSSLRICDYPEGTKITTIGEKAFYGCTNLKLIRVSDDLSSLGVQAFQACPNLVFVGPMLPKAMTELTNTALQLNSGNKPNSKPLQDGVLEIGGSGKPFTWKMGSNTYNNHFVGFNITNLIFGAGVPDACIKSTRSSGAIKNPYEGAPITNIVVKNSGVFAFGKIFEEDGTSTYIRNYDVAGWVTGTLVKRTAGLAVSVPEERQETAKLYQTRIMAAKNAYWKEFKKARDANKSKYYTPWSELSVDVQQAYWDNFNGGTVGSGDAVPLGLTKGITSYSLTLEGEEPLDPLTIPDNVWVVFKEGPWPDSGFKVIVR